MTTEQKTQECRLLIPAELAAMTRMFREMRRWSQEQLADLSGLNVRTIQRVEQAMPASLDTRRAVARAFGFEDIDVFSKPLLPPSDEAVKAAKEKFEREYVILAAHPLTTGRQLAKLAEASTMDLSEPAFEMGREAEQSFAELVDYFREYRGCADMYIESGKFEIYDALQAHIDNLLRLQVSLRHAERKVQLKVGSDAKDTTPMSVTILYVIAFQLGQEPTEFATPRTGELRP
jgi:transcriptional regulator with XRE-family HTH domain